MGATTIRPSDESPACADADILLASQFCTIAGANRDSGEKRLMLAVLIDAISLLRGRGTVVAGKDAAASIGLRRKLSAEAQRWIAYDDDGVAAGGVFSFVSICQELGIDAAQLRRALRQPEAMPAVRRARIPRHHELGTYAIARRAHHLAQQKRRLDYETDYS